jgi:hypothetical protein
LNIENYGEIGRINVTSNVYVKMSRVK